ncbi:hypothetical protein D1224_09330 [Henriciella barbarensis]|uniref:G domain-containing protein n=1 Tax=Henriciella barbarensis TaxID=86342 RepID=A0A399QZU0_9PROT|nr:GTPase domain-containing protein [Henriciella barbarensis]RIJ24418.1 hypothetical protein D1224_09330 [Henriciella barbarensis]
MEEAKLAWDLIQFLRERGLLEKLFDMATQKQTSDVLVLGASGTGKSAFLKKIIGDEPFIHRHQRSPDVETESGKLGNCLFRLQTTPGQVDEVHSKNRIGAIREAAASKNLGIINVVSFGYHEGLADTKEVFDGAEVRASYLEGRRDLELKLANEWSNFLCGQGGAAKWIITVITKADIWWGTELQPAVMEYYSNGAYVKALGQGANLPHSVLTYSTLNQKFYGVLPLSGQYEDDLRSMDHKRLVATMIEYASK